MDPITLAKQIVEEAAADGAEIEVFIQEGTETTIGVSNREVEKLSQSGSRGMGVRAIVDGQQGYAYTADLSDESVRRTWQTALELAQVATADEFRRLPDPQPVPDEDLQIHDPALSEVPVTAKVDFIKRLEAAALDYDERILTTVMCTYIDQSAHIVLANSKGFSGAYDSSVVVGYLMAIARGEDGEMTQAFGLDASPIFSALDAQAIGQEGARKALSMLNAKPVPTQKTTVVLDHVVGAQILYAISQALTADSWQRSRSFLMGRMGQQVGSDMVSIVDNGRLARGIASAPFDGEGVPTGATRLIDEGVLQGVLHDSYTAAKDGTASTGNAQRSGHTGLPSLGASNFYIQPGYLSRDEIIAGVQDGFYVLEVMQTGGVDPVTGDCSMSASGIWIKDGQLTDPVNGVTIATTLDDFLMHISAVGSDLRQMPIVGGIAVPTLRVDNVTVGGEG
ncbi:MAG: TldD/PmbA family protein [Chloroflexi bacterium]|nr:TldD/PmbA family protein [Chloroflexota bacterium]